jgi:hypothetical protein
MIGLDGTAKVQSVEGMVTVRGRGAPLHDSRCIVPTVPKSQSSWSLGSPTLSPACRAMSCARSPFCECGDERGFVPRPLTLGGVKDEVWHGGLRVYEGWSPGNG